MGDQTISYVDCDEPGIQRRGTTRFRYIDQVTGRPVGAKARDRIEALAIPPAWTDVWICRDADGHIQATGRDDRGRKQYRYHATFRQRRERRKFHALVPFGESLGALRSRVDADLRSPALSRERVIAAVVSLLEQTYLRVGNEGYAKENKTFGLTTLRDRHVHVDGSQLHLRFTGKGGATIDVTCCDPRLARVVKRCQDLPGQVLFQYLGDDGERARVTSTDVNEYLRSATDVDATAKTFRTWGATLLAAQLLVDEEPPTSARAATRTINEAIDVVAGQLGNTRAVCRASYVHPTIPRRYEDGDLRALWDAGPSRRAGGLEVDERRLLRVLETPAR